MTMYPEDVSQVKEIHTRKGLYR